MPFPKLVRMHVVVHISIDFFVLGGGDDDGTVQLVNLPISFGALLLYHALETMVAMYILAERGKRRGGTVSAICFTCFSYRSVSLSGF